MGNHDDRRGSNRSIPPAISPSQAGELSRMVHEARGKSLDNEKRIQALEATVNDKSQWNNTVREWIGKQVLVYLVTGDNVRGVLRSLDRYTLQVAGRIYDKDGDLLVGAEESELIIHKGSIAVICQDK